MVIESRADLYMVMVMIYWLFVLNPKVINISRLISLSQSIIHCKDDEEPSDTSWPPSS